MSSRMSCSLNRIKNVKCKIERKKFSWERIKQKVSFSVDGKTIIFNELKKGDDILFLYGQNIEKELAFLSFIKTALNSDEFCLYAFDTKGNKLHLETNSNLELFPINSAQIGEINNRIYKILQSGKPTRILIDFGNLANKGNIKDILYCEELIQKVIQESKLVWSRYKYRKGLKPTSVIALTAFDVSSLENESVKSLMQLHKKVVFSTENEFTALLPNFSTINSIGKGSLDSIPFEAMEQIVKANLEMIILSLISEKPACGFHIIKTISQQYHVFLSQGTVYPMLYSLESSGILRAQKSSKSKVYTMTEQGREIVEKRLADFLKAHEHLFSLLSKNNIVSDFETK